MELELFADERLNAILARCLALQRGEKINFFSVLDSMPDDRLLEVIRGAVCTGSSRSLSSIATSLKNWLCLRVSANIFQDAAPEISYREFDNCLRAVTRSVDSDQCVNYAAAAHISRDDIAHVMSDRRLFGAQLDWVGLYKVCQLIAYRQWSTAEVNLVKLQEDDSVECEDVDDTQLEIEAMFVSEREEAMKEMDGESDEAIGREIYHRCMAECAKRDFTLGGRRLPPGLAEGICQVMANSGRIGWHVRFHELVKKFEATYMEAGHGHLV